jgi:hypothetical protein
VNDRGTVLFRGVEWSDDAGRGLERVSLWRNGVLTPLPELNALDFVVPLGLGPNDEVFGRIEGNEWKGFVRWADGGVEVFVGTKDGTIYEPKDVVAMNAHGDFIRRRYGAEFDLVTASGVHPIPNPLPGVGMGVLDLNNEGIVVGYYGGTDGAAESPFVWSLDGGFRSDIAEGCYEQGGGGIRVSNSGTILMTCACPQLNGDPLLYSLSDGSVRALGGLFLPNLWIADLNDRGWVSANETSYTGARLLRNGGRCDVQKMLPPEDEWFIEGVGALNNTGLLLAMGRKPDAGEIHMYPLILQLDVHLDGGIEP